jgi:rhamnose utilization protein RhaD (predicted bifunctional aldolase and dehydrogenase)
MLSELVRISNYYGQNKDYVLAGGGNTSYKDENFLYIKGSGTTLATITEDGFVKINRKKLAKVWEKEYPEDTKRREGEVLADLMEAREDKSKRPSVETSLHDLFSQAYVVHTHPALINGLTCSACGEKAAREIFGDDMIWIAPTMPGYVLASEVKTKIEEYQKTGKRANLVFLANHGVFIAGDTVQEIIDMTEGVYDAVKSRIKRFPDMSPAILNPQPDKIKNALDANFITFVCNNEILNYIQNENEFKKVYSAFTPDHMVYYNHKAMFVEKIDDAEDAAKGFSEKYGFLPKITAVRGNGVYACGESEKAAQTAAELFCDTVKIAVYAESFGGGVFMPDWLIDFIANWEVESYRKSVAEK